ncbi:hypothetical protein SAMN04488540_104226 [Ferrimonas sediminum]|uniref:Uncharacterized protein n=1 Tax=Ferrimonas sediminum TaxID=718193 RepID=A0A1G8Q9N5_9GAMM|nr:hypothetical protein SAMN04488540_104226 [Ferrimonas sediminum]
MSGYRLSHNRLKVLMTPLAMAGIEVTARALWHRYPTVRIVN